jgi:hypothetical protein
VSKLLVVALAVSAAFATVAAAQEPIEALPPPDQAVEPAQPAGSDAASFKTASGLAGPREPRWRTALRLSGGYDSNVNLASADEALSDTPGQVLGSVKGRFGREPWRLGLQAEAGANLYPKVSEFNAPVFGGNLDVERKSSPHTRLFMRHNYRRDYVRSIVRVVDAGLVPGKVLSSTYTGGLGFQQGLAPRVSMIADASYDRVSYDEDRLPAGDTLALSAGLAWDLHETERMDLTYRYHSTRTGGLDGQGHGAALAWSRRLTRALDAGIVAGIARDEPLGSLETVTPWSLAGRLAGTHRRHRVSASYRHSLEQAYGFGRSLLFDTVSLDEDYALTPRFSTGLRGSYSRGRDPIGGSSYRLRGWSALGELAYRVSPRTSARLVYSYVTTGDSDRPDVSSHLLEFSLSYDRPWR